MGVTDILSIQLYTLRSLESLDRILDTVAEAGFRYVETVGSHLEGAVGVRAKLDARGLAASSSHVSLAALRERPEFVAEACRTLGFTQLFMPSVPPEQRDMDAEGWRALGRELGEMALRFHDQGITLGYHNHDWELRPKADSKTALELIFEAAGDSPLAWQVDVAWLARGGADPKAWIEHYRGRIASAHVKDIAPAGRNEDQDGWADVGSGILDWRDLWQTCRRSGAAWMVVEHDRPADPVTTARASFAFLSKIED
ncbi:sugar phosphate isomerase/epimerase family protein [Arenibaculum pallidiluteum]|uniref:sugar phosphate isomerase/epimerase family protein n=1 Tax=Arenibaculum pallidiluteum TaxID=2812559 RepID=UPI001A963DC8|nr:sugar phosphate isomerase/epimerase [Arenibaculum pallidiluteum]